MKTAWKTRPTMSAIYSTRNANDPASRVPNPLFSPLPNVAPEIYKQKGWNERIYYIFN